MNRSTVLKIGVSLLIAIGVFIALIPTILSNHTIQQYVIAKVNESREEKIDVEDAQFGWISGLLFKNLTIKNPQKNLSLTLVNATANYSLMNYFKSGIILSDATCENGLLTLKTTAGKEVLVDNLSVNLSVNKSQAITCDAKGVVRKDQQAGSFTIVGFFKDYTNLKSDYKNCIEGKECSANISLDCEAKQIPCEVLDILLTDSNDIVQNALGDTLDLSLSHHLNVEGDFLKLLVTSKNLQSNLIIEKLSIPSSNTISWNVTPQFFEIVDKNYLKKDIKLTKPTKLLISLNSLSKEALFPFKLKIEGSEPISLTKKNIPTKIVLSCVIDTISEKLLKGLLNIQTVGSKTPSLVKANFELTDFLSQGDVKFDVNANGSLIYLFSDYSDALDTLLGKNIVYTLNGEGKNIFSDTPSFSGNSDLTSSNLSQKAQFETHDEVLFIKPSESTLKLNQQDASLLFTQMNFKGISAESPVDFSFVASQISIPLKSDSCFENTQINAKLLMLPLQINVDPAKTLNIDSFEVDINKDNGSPLSISANWKGSLHKAHEKIQSVCGNKINGSINATVANIQSEPTIDLNAKIDSENLSLDIPNVSLKLGNSPSLSSSSTVKLDLLIKKRDHVDEKKVPFGSDAKMHVEISPFKNVQFLRQKGKINGNAYIEEFETVKDPFKLDIPFELDMKREIFSLQMNIASPKSDKGLITGKVIYNFGKAEGPKLTVDSTCKNLPIRPFLTLIKQDRYTPLFGPTISGNLNCEFTNKEKRISTQLNGKGLSIDISLSIGEKIQALSNRPPIIFKMDLTKERLPLIHGHYKHKGKEIDLQLKEDTFLELRINKIDVDTKAKNLGSLLNSMEIDGELFCDKVLIEKTAKEPQYLLPPLKANIQLNGPSKSLLFEVKTTSTNKAESNLNITGKFSDLWNEKGFQLNQGDVEFNAKIQKWPFQVLQKFPFLEALSRVLHLTGPNLNADVSLKLNKMKDGDISCKITGDEFLGEIDAQIKDHNISLKNDAQIKFTLTPYSRKNAFKDSNSFLSSGIKGDLPVAITVGKEGFSIPISPFSFQNVLIKNIKIEIGKAELAKKGFVDALTKILKPLSSQKEILFECTPIYLELQDGKLNVKRVDALVGGHFHLATWGFISFKENAVHMIIGIHRNALKQALGIKQLPQDYFLQLPLTGTLEQPELSTKVIALKIAALSKKSEVKKKGKNDVMGLLGGLYDIAVDQVFQDEPVPPPTTYPFPWQEPN